MTGSKHYYSGNNICQSRHSRKAGIQNWTGCRIKSGMTFDMFNLIIPRYLRRGWFIYAVAFRDVLDMLERIPYKYGNISIETIPYSLT